MGLLKGGFLDSFCCFIFYFFTRLSKVFLRNLILLLFSFFFYYKSGGGYIWLLIFSTVTDFYFAIGISKTSKKFFKRLYLFASILCNLGLLAYYKYAYLLVSFVNKLIGISWVAKDYLAEFMNTFLNTHFEVEQIILPVGISFYIFQTLSYTIDVYREKITPTQNLLEFALFVSFFPQLVAGPIVRASEFLPQLRQAYNISSEEIGKAFTLITFGMTKKILADYISVNWVSRTFENPLIYSGLEHLISAYSFAIQIYFDFSGYTDIAAGLALLLGFYLPINFNKPYHSVSITEFWRRWHISLSFWLRDYLYISLGGNRSASLFTYSMLWVGITLVLLLEGVEFASIIFEAIVLIVWLLWLKGFRNFWGYVGLHILVVWAGLLYTQRVWVSFFTVCFVFVMWFLVIWNTCRRLPLSTYANLMLTMLIGGLWHGADMRFIVWGGMHGLALGFHKFWRFIAHKFLPSSSKVWNVVAQVFTFHFVCFTWFFFRAAPIEIGEGKWISAFEVAQIIFYKLFYQFGCQYTFEFVKEHYTFMLLLIGSYVLYFLPTQWKFILQGKFTALPTWGKAICIFLWIVFFYYPIRALQNQPFIYFQF